MRYMSRTESLAHPLPLDRSPAESLATHLVEIPGKAVDVLVIFVCVIILQAYDAFVLQGDVNNV